MLTSYFSVLFVLFVDLFYLRKIEVTCIASLNGRYTKSIENYELTVPHRLSMEGEFVSFTLPQYFKHDFRKKRRKRSLDDPDLVHYGVTINDQDYHISLWPNHDFLSPDLIFEERDPKLKVKDKNLRTLVDKNLCHYTGHIRGYRNSRAALSTCEGLAGYITLNNVRYFIEPVEEHEPNKEGQHLHVVYEAEPKLDAYKTNRCGTTESWEEAWKRRFRDKMKRGENVDKRGATSEHRYLETLIVADKKFLLHHKNRDVEAYVLTIMNIVADYYHDASSGNQMDVVVVRIMYLEKEEEEIDLIINEDADKTLTSFCKWQQTVNPKDIENPNHHDIAVLMTRWDICADKNEDCGLMGLAFVAAACTQDKPCAINEDGGLQLGVVVAHEMGHVMGCAHDKEGESSCPAQDRDESFFVMAPYVHLFTTKWSTCSRGFITALFENGLGDCLNDEPQTSLYKYREALPGTVYDAEAQCEMNYPGSTICMSDQVEFCEMLLCRVDPMNCMGNEEPPADGTKCGENKWCFHKKCVEIGERPEAINGGWGSWGSWSTCSRTCGGGVSMAERDCTNPVPKFNGRYCLGDRKKVKLCNLLPCPQGSISFRELQCNEKNKELLGGQYHQWTTYLNKKEICVLYCSNELNQFSKLEPRVKDGTPCKPGTRDMCISGVCKKIGCDNQIDSDAVEDICGVCNGDGTQCKISEEVYRDTGARGYKKIATIPAGSRNVEVTELAPSMNTIAVTDKTERRYYLNGNHEERNDGEVSFGAITGVYSHPEPGKESLIIHGPLIDDLILFVVFYRPENVGYHIKYAEASADLGYTPHYQWELLEWTDCSQKCGGGVKTSKFDCVEDKAGKVSNNFCVGLEKPETNIMKCNEDPCKTKWKVGKWGKCRACRHRSGVRMREVECVQEAPRAGAEDILVDDNKCKGPKPGSRELCEAPHKCRARHVDNIPTGLLESVWSQIHRKSVKREGWVNDLDGIIDAINANSHNASCTENATTVHLDVGKMVTDRVPAEEIKVIKVPLKQTHLSLNLSDNAFETMGDAVGDSLDTGHAEIATGDKAAKILKQLAHHTYNQKKKVAKKPKPAISQAEMAMALAKKLREQQLKEKTCPKPKPYF